MPVTEDQVREQLKKVIDPELFVNIVDLGLIYVVDLDEAGADAGGETTDGESSERAPVGEETASGEAAGDPAPAAEPNAADSQTGDAVSAEESPAESEAAPAASATGPLTNVKIEMTMTSPMCPAGPQLVANSKQVVGQIDGVGEVEVKVVMDPPWTPDRMTDEAKDTLGIF